MRTTDLCFARLGQRFAVAEIGDGQWRVVDRGHFPLPRGRKRAHQMPAKAHIAPPAIEPRIGPNWRSIKHGNRLNPDRIAQLWRKKGLKQRGFERQDLFAISAGTFGKEQQPMVIKQPSLKNLGLFAGMFGAAFNEQRAGRLGQPPDAGPAGDLRL